MALATRLAVSGSLTFHDREFGDLDERAIRFSRDLLGVDLYATPTYRFLFFVAHLKSKMGGDSLPDQARDGGDARSATIIEKPQFGAGQPYIEQDMVVCGDMNEDPGQEPIEILKGKGGATPLRDILEDGGPTYPTHTRYRKTRLDYIFASPSIAIEDAKVHRERRRRKRRPGGGAKGFRSLPSLGNGPRAIDAWRSKDDERPSSTSATPGRRAR